MPSKRARSIIAAKCKEASSRLMAYEAESRDLKQKVAAAGQKVAGLEKDAEALKIAMQLVLDDNTRREVEEKFAAIRTKDLNVVKEAMNLELSSFDKTASLGDLCDDPNGLGSLDPARAFANVLMG